MFMFALGLASGVLLTVAFVAVAMRSINDLLDEE